MTIRWSHWRCPLHAAWWRVKHIRNGFRFHYPPCCVLRFALHISAAPAARRGACVGKRPDSLFVPCGIWHHHDPDRPPHLDPERFGGRMCWQDRQDFWASHEEEDCDTMEV